MQRFFLLFLVLAIFFIKAFGQSSHSKNNFNLKGELLSSDTGRIIFWHADTHNIIQTDTLKLTNGKFYFAGTVNHACEAYLWTNLKNIDFDDSSVIRFLLEPNNIHISYKPHSGLNAIITGSRSETEKEEWDKQKSSLLIERANIYKSIYSLSKLSKTNSSAAIEDQINILYSQRDTIVEKITKADVKYIKTYPNSYLSAYLLFRHKRSLSNDSIKFYYSSLSNNVKKSSVAHDVLEYVYPLTDDNEFRKNNPLIDIAFDERLSKLKSVYDLSLKDTSGNTIELSAFKSKYIVIDFWASWCSPCIDNIPALNELIKHYKSDSIQFISISIDRDGNNWEKAIVKHHFTGIQLSDLNGYNSLAAIYCKVIWVPKYIIADANGKIINYDAPQPIDPGLKNILDKLLKQKFE